MRLFVIEIFVPDNVTCMACENQNVDGEFRLRRTSGYRNDVGLDFSAGPGQLHSIPDNWAGIYGISRSPAYPRLWDEDICSRFPSPLPLKSHSAPPKSSATLYLAKIDLISPRSFFPLYFFVLQQKLCLHLNRGNPRQQQ